MSVTLGGLPCLDPAALQRDCLDRGLPTDPWYGLANSFRCPVGEQPGTGYALLDHDSLASLDLSAAYDLTLTDDLGNSQTIRSLTITRADCITPSSTAGSVTAYLVRLADRRLHLARVPVDVAYNLRDGSGNYLAATKYNPSTAWSWSQVGSDLWGKVGGLGSWPGLPFSPDGTPENLDYYGGYAWHALCDFLDRLACAIEYDPTADTFAIVRLGSSDSAAVAVESSLSGQRVWDAYPSDPARAWQPAAIDVLFRRFPAPTDGTSPFWVETVSAGGPVSGTTVRLVDDLSALGASGTPTNSAALATRASERAADWLRKRSGFGRPLLRVYRGARSGPGFAGSTAREWAAHDRSKGVVTEVASGPDDLLERWRPAVPAPPSGWYWYRITGRTSGTPPTYSWERVRFVMDTGSGSPGWIAEDPAVTGSSNAYRAPSTTADPPPIPTGQVVLGRPSPTAAGKHELTAWGGQFEFTRERVIDVTCDAGELVLVVKTEIESARDYCVRPAPG